MAKKEKSALGAMKIAGKEVDLVDIALKSGLTILGYVSGKTGMNVMEKKILKGDVEGVKKFIPSATTGLLGIVALVGGTSYVQTFGAGVTAASVLAGVKSATGKDYSSGFLGEVDFGIDGTAAADMLPPPYPHDEKLDVTDLAKNIIDEEEEEGIS